MQTPIIATTATINIRKIRNLPSNYYENHTKGVKNQLFFTTLTATVVFTLPVQAKRQTSLTDSLEKVGRPNILFFMVDDMGWQDTSVPFWKEITPRNRTYHTPSMEQMEESAVKFTDAYAASVSSPSRVSLMTGMNPAAHRVTNWTFRLNESPDPKNPILEYPEWSMNGISSMQEIKHTTYVTPLPQLLREAGYHTSIVGKAHFGVAGAPGSNPLMLGFDTNVAGHAAGSPASYLGSRNFGNVPGAEKQLPNAVPDLERYWGEDIFLTEALTLEAKNQIDTALMIDKPFFLYMSHYAVHVPFDRDMRFYDKYIEKGLDPREAAYAALVEGMDKSLGDLRNYLKEKGIDKNTIVIFFSDNGGLSAWGRGGKLNTHNQPLRSGKGSPMEGGLRVPMMVEWPGVTDDYTNCVAPVVVQDLMPTILEMAQVKNVRTVQRIDGQSIVPLLQGDATMHRYRPLVWHYPNMWGVTGDGIGTYSAMREGDWKLIYYYDTRKTMLFNLSEDIFEKIDHSSNPSQAKRRKHMAARLTRELRRMEAQVPWSRIEGEWCRWPDGSRYGKIPENRSDIHF